MSFGAYVNFLIQIPAKMSQRRAAARWPWIRLMFTLSGPQSGPSTRTEHRYSVKIDSDVRSKMQTFSLLVTVYFKAMIFTGPPLWVVLISLLLLSHAEITLGSLLSGSAATIFYTVYFIAVWLAYGAPFQVYLITCQYYALSMDTILQSMILLRKFFANPKPGESHELCHITNLLRLRMLTKVIFTLNRLLCDLSRDDHFWRWFILITYLTAVPLCGFGLLMTALGLTLREVCVTCVVMQAIIGFVFLSFTALLTLSAGRCMQSLAASLLEAHRIQVSATQNFRYFPVSLSRQLNALIRYGGNSLDDNQLVGFTVGGLHPLRKRTFFAVS